MGNSSSASSSRNRESGSASVSGSASPQPQTGGANSPPRPLAAASSSNNPGPGSASATLSQPSTSATRSSGNSPAAIEAEAASAVAAIAAAASIPTLYAQDSRVDNGHIVPLSNIYPTSPQDWIHDTVQRLIVERKLAPFYRGLEDWEGEEEFERELVDKELDGVGDERSIEWRKGYTKNERGEEAAMYKKASECPICFLYYPPLINTSRCCDQPICTECFVQIKRADPTTTNMVSEPAACPYCVEPNFGVTYISPPPSRRTGLGAPKNGQSTSKSMHGTGAPELTRSLSTSSATSDHEMGPAASAHSRRKSVSHTASEVVTVDSIQADWEAKLAAVRATAARRAARRVVFRQVGDRLVPVGISSGRELNPATTRVDDQGRIILTSQVQIVGQSLGGGAREGERTRGDFGGALVEGGGGGGGGLGSASRLLSRSTRPRGGSQGQPGTSDPRMMGMEGIDIEEMLLQEAMRLSMVDEEERQKKADKEAKAAAKKEKKESSSSSSSTPVGAAKKLFGKSSSNSNSIAEEGGSSSKAGSSSGRASPRVSMDTSARTSMDTTRPSTSTTTTTQPPSASTSASASPSTPSTSTFIPQSNNPYSSRIGGSTKSSFLRMPPMQRNDSSASMTFHNLPAPLVPTVASGENAASRRNGSQGQGQGQQRISLQDLEDNDGSLL